MKTRAWLALAVLALGLIAPACIEQVTGGGGAREIVLRLEMAAVQSDTAVSVAERVTLTVTPEGGSPRRFEQTLERGQFGATFPVRVTEGLTRFEAQVFSNDRGFNPNPVLLFSGEATRNVTRDDFTVTIPIVAQTGFFFVTRDSLRQISTQVPVVFSLKNLGSKLFSWEIREVLGSDNQMVPFCPTRLPPCVAASPRSDSLLPGATDPLSVQINAPAGQTFRVRLVSDVGDVDVRVTTP